MTLEEVGEGVERFCGMFGQRFFFCFREGKGFPHALERSIRAETRPSSAVQRGSRPPPP